MNNQSIEPHFEMLELQPGASLKEIKESYRELVQVWHPDRFQTNPNLQKRAHLKLQQINESYEVLKNYYEHNEYYEYNTAPQNPANEKQSNDRQTRETQRSTVNILEQVVNILNRVPGMTVAHPRDFRRSVPRFILADGSVVKTWKNPVGVDHVFIADQNGDMIFGGFVGWIHSEDLYRAIIQIQNDLT